MLLVNTSRRVARAARGNHPPTPTLKPSSPKRLRAARHMLTRRPKVAANLAPPSYYSTSAIVNRLATPDPNPRSVPRGFSPKFEDFPSRSLPSTNENVGRD